MGLEESQAGMKERFLELYRTSDSIEVDGAFIRHYHGEIDQEAGGDEVVIDLDVSDSASSIAITNEELDDARMADDGKTWIVGGHYIEFFTVTPNDMTNVLIVGQAPIIKDYVMKAKNAVTDAAIEAGISPMGFTIDSSLCDCGSIEVVHIVNIIDDAATNFGRHGSDNYSYIVDHICDELNQHFSKIAPTAILNHVPDENPAP